MSCLFESAVSVGRDSFIRWFYWFSTQCALCGGVPETFFSVRSAICSVGRPAVSIQSPLRSHSFSLLCTSFVDLGPQKTGTRTCPRRVGAFSTAEQVFPFSSPLIISKLGCRQGIATCTTPLSQGPQSPLWELQMCTGDINAHIYQQHRWTVILSKFIMFELDLKAKQPNAYLCTCAHSKYTSNIYMWNLPWSFHGLQNGPTHMTKLPTPAHRWWTISLAEHLVVREKGIQKAVTDIKRPADNLISCRKVCLMSSLTANVSE